LKITAWFRKWIRRWPFIWPFLVIGIVFIFYIDGNVVPTLTKRHLILWGVFDLADISWLIPPLSLFTIFLISEAISIPQMTYSYWFLGWVGRLTINLAKQLAEKAEKEEIVQEAIQRGKQIELRLEREGFIQRIQNELIKWYRKITDENHRLWKYLKGGGILTFIVLAVSPEPFARTIALIACRSINKKKYFVMLVICDAIKTAYMVLGWHIIIRKLSWQAAMVLGILFLLWLLYKKYTKKEQKA